MKILIRFIESYLRAERLESFKGKNNNIFNLIKHKPVPKYPESKVPITNFIIHQVTDTEYQQLKLSLNYSIIHKDKKCSERYHNPYGVISLYYIKKSRKHSIRKFPWISWRLYWYIFKERF